MVVLAVGLVKAASGTAVDDHKQLRAHTDLSIRPATRGDSYSVRVEVEEVFAGHSVMAVREERQPV